MMKCSKISLERPIDLADKGVVIEEVINKLDGRTPSSLALHLFREWGELTKSRHGVP